MHDANLDIAPPPEAVRVRVLPDGRMTRKDAATYLGVALHTLNCWASDGKGPPFVRVGGKTFYFKAQLDAFIAMPSPKKAA